MENEVRELITLIVQIIFGLSILIGGITVIVRWIFKVEKRLTIIEQKIDKLPSRIRLEVFQILMTQPIDRIMQEDNPLSKEEINLRNRLLIKLQNNTIAEDEAIRLRELLEIENEEAKKKAKWDLVIAIGIVLGGIALILELAKKK